MKTGKAKALGLKIDKNPSRCKFVSEINKGICETNMHITGQTGIQLNGCDWHSSVLDNTIDIAYEENEIEKLNYFKKEILKGNSQGFRFIPSLSNIFGDSHLYLRKADNYLPFDYLCADCVRSYVEFINYLLLLSKYKGHFKKKTIADKDTFPFSVYQFLFDEKQEEEVFFYLEKLRQSLKNDELKQILKEFIEYSKKELENV